MSSPRRLIALVRRGCVALGVVLFTATQLRADEAPSVLELSYTPVARAQVAIWIENAAGEFLTTVALTDAVAYRGLGNRVGGSQMNSGYRWPWGRREGVLPIWARRRASAEGAQLFPRVIFQERPEGNATRMVFDQSPDDYYCLQFQESKSKLDGLDAVSCATVFNSDKGRYLTQADVDAGYSEPWEDPASEPGGAPSGLQRPLSLQSFYPPRMDVTRCTAEDCYDHADVERFAADARAAMPEIDAVSRATAPGDMPQQLLFSVPADWPAGEYSVFLEINVEGDYAEHWDDARFPTPQLPKDGWDFYALTYGYPYRGQPSVVYRVSFTLGSEAALNFATDLPVGRGSWDYRDFGELVPLASDGGGGIADSDGSGADRLRRDALGHRFSVLVDPPIGGLGSERIGAVTGLELRRHENPLRAHTWVRLRFGGASSERRLHGYQVRVATEPIVDEASFIRNGRPAKSATDAAEGASELMIPGTPAPGEVVEAVIGDLAASTHYYVGVRAQDDRNRVGPLSVAEITTPAREFSTVSPCFVATAAYGSPLAREISALRRFRDRQLKSTGPGRAFCALYDRLGPHAARAVARDGVLRAAVRALLSAAIELLARMP